MKVMRQRLQNSLSLDTVIGTIITVIMIGLFVYGIGSKFINQY